MNERHSRERYEVRDNWGPVRAQRSVSHGERRSDGVNEHCRWRQSERYAVRDDAIRHFAQGHRFELKEILRKNRFLGILFHMNLCYNSLLVDCGIRCGSHQRGTPPKSIGHTTVKEVLPVTKRKTAVPFKGTAEQEKQLKELINSYKEVPGALMPVLQQAQDIYGYLPMEVQQMIAEGLGVPLAEVYGIVTFYAQFTLNPKGQYAISVCLGTACYVKGSGTVLERLEHELGIKDGGTTPDGRFSLEATRCLGACGLAPVIVINGDVYGNLTPDMVPGVLAKYN